MQHLLLVRSLVVDWFNAIRNILIQFTLRNSQYKHTELINGIPECKNEVWFLQKISIMTMRSQNVRYITNIEINNTRIVTFSRSPKGSYTSRSTKVFKYRNLNTQLEENHVNKIVQTYVCNKRLCLAGFQTHYQKKPKIIKRK